jgi:HK97 family phage portal protein
MGFWSRVRAAAKVMRSGDVADDHYFNGALSAPMSATGVSVSQLTAMQATAVMGCVRILAEDVSKMPPWLFLKRDDGGRTKVENHWLADLLWQPNPWQTWPEFCRQMVAAFALRGNAWAVIVRDARGRAVMLVPINPDRAHLWQSPDGSLFVMVTRNGLHEMAVLRDQPLLIPYEDMLHIKDLSADGLVGLSPIGMAREAVALSLAQEQQYARLMGNGARPSGVLTTDKTLTEPVAKRLKQDWKDLHSGLLNSGKTAVLEAGLKWQPLSLNAVDMQFLQLRQFQLGEICRIFRVPPHMLGDLTRGTMQNIVQQAQEYRNNTLTSHTDVWERRFDFTFGLRRQGMFVDFDESTLLKADLLARYNAYRIGKFGGWLTTNMILLGEGANPIGPEGDVFWSPTNMTDAANTGMGSEMTGETPPGSGQPAQDNGNDPDATDQAAPQD